MKKQLTNHFKITLSYQGTHYCGWQKQSQGEKTIQGELEKALSKITNGGEFSTLGSGRTDAGVHALGQVVKIDLNINIDETGLLKVLNSYLPKDIRVLNVESSDEEFMPTVHAKSKEYRYYFSIDPVVPSPLNLQLAHLRYELDIELMKKAAQLFVGEHDFQNYFCVGTPVKSTVRTIYNCEILTVDNFFHPANSQVYLLKIEGNGFLKQMVRLIMGALIEVGKGKASLQDIENSLKESIDSKVGATAPAEGLYLYAVQY
jgi:tRNA pseudouridine38-40 synthase